MAWKMLGWRVFFLILQPLCHSL